MRVFPGCLFVLLASTLLAQDGPVTQPDSQTSPTPIQPAPARPLDADPLPSYRLRRAGEELADLQDKIILDSTLYNSAGADLTEEKSGEMLEAARRRVERRQAEVEWVKSLVDAGALARLRVTEPIEQLDWAKRELGLAESRAKLVKELAELARAEELAMQQNSVAPDSGPLAEKFDGTHFSPRLLRQVELDFETHFRKALPVSARGETALHRALGFDHRDRMDVAVHPDEPDGVWLLSYLRQAGIPFFAFRGLVPGKATAPHIHIGPPSGRLANRGS